MAKADRRTPDQQKQGDDLRKEGAKWIARIEAAGKLEKNWMDDAERAVKAYTGEIRPNDLSTSAALGNTYDFNILYANVETIVPAIINSPPAPDIRRRFADEDPAAKDVAEMIERAIRKQVDDSKLQVELEGEAQDGFLAGRGIIRLRFKSDFIKDETTNAELERASDAQEGSKPKSDDADESAEGYGIPAEAYGAATQPGTAPTERLANECIEFEAVSWRDYRHGPARRWKDRPWDAFRFVVQREDEGSVFDAGLISVQTNDAEKKARGESDSDLTGWEVWDKGSRKVIFVDDNGVVLKKVDDPLGLIDFFCIPAPVQPIEVTGRLMPVNPFSIYSKLADELDLTTRRINLITNKMRVKGWYPGDAGDIKAMVDADDDDFVPIANAEIWAANGGLSGAVAFWPVEKFILVLRELYGAREQTKQAIYEITGISDIVRGASQASETATAQNIKTQWGSLRIQKMQRMMERCARDIFVMMAEIIPSKFSHETLQQMTGIQIIPTQQDLTQVQPPPAPPQGAELPPEAQQQYQLAIQAAQQAEQARKAKLAKLQAIQQLLTQPLAMMYRIDVESDSTVKADLTRQKAETAEFMQAAGAYWAAVGPLVQSGELSKEVAVEIFAANSRLFNLGKSVEDVLEKMVTDAKTKAGQPQQPKPNPEQVKAEADAKAKEQDMAAKAQDADLSRQAKEQDMQQSRELHGMKMAELNAQSEQRTQQHQQTIEGKRTDADAKRIEAGLPGDEAWNGVVQALIADREIFKALIAEVAKGQQAIGDAIERQTAVALAPKTFIKDKTGKPIGVQTAINTVN